MATAKGRQSGRVGRAALPAGTEGHRFKTVSIRDSSKALFVHPGILGSHSTAYHRVI